MQQDHLKNGPVVIGGVCGSGTRVIAEILAALDFYMGDDLNRARDNLLYTLLFKRPKWFYKHCQDMQAINTGLSLLQKIMTSRNAPSYQEWSFLLRAVTSKVFFGHNYRGRGRGLWPLIRLKKVMAPRKPRDGKYVGWGWKEPHALLLIRHMDNYFDDFKYIHTLRHGLDMAFSRNQEQLYVWGPLYGVERPRCPSELPAASFRFWVRVNCQIIQTGEKMGPERFLLVNFDELCRSPQKVIQSITSFLNINPHEKTIRRILQLPQRPYSMGRYRDHDLNQFAGDDLSSLQQLGFSIDQA